MIQNIKLLLVVLALIGSTYWVFRRWMCPHLLPLRQLNALALGWLGVSTALFLAPNFWVFCLITFGLLVWLGGRLHPATILCGFLYSAPYLERLLPGFAGINELLSLSYPRLLILTCLLLWQTRWQKKGKTAQAARSGFDLLVLFYGLYNLVLQLLSDTMTNTLRVYAYYLIDTVLVYWAGRHWAKDRRVLLDALAAFSFGVMVVCVIAAFEFGKGWLLYSQVGESLSAFGTTGRYLARGDSGLIRASATAGHSIPMGFLAMVGIILWLGLSEAQKLPATARTIGLGLLAMGSVASLSRGPWLALAAGLILWYSMSPKGLRRLLQALVIMALLFGVALMTPARDEIISLIPWVGTSDSANIDYRERLILVSLFLIFENPWFGSPTFMSAPIMQQLIQGQGIIDLVNTYVALALSSGFVGLGLFVGIVLGPLFRGAPLYLAQLFQATKLQQPDLVDPVFRSVLCTLLSSAIAIGTVSSITVIPWTYWLLAGLAVNLIQCQSNKPAPSIATPHKP